MKNMTRALSGLAMLCAVFVGGVIYAPTPVIAQAVGYFQQAGVGAVLRTFISKMRDRVDTRDFGAVCDGSTDDRLAIQRAGDAAIALGAALFVQPSVNGCLVEKSPSGNYALLWQNQIKITGTPGRSIILPGSSLGSTNEVIYLTGDATTYKPTIIDGIMIGNPSAGTRFGHHAIVLDTLQAGGFPRAQIINNYLQQPTSGAGSSVFAINSEAINPVGGLTQALFSNNIIGSGISLNKSGDSLWVTNNTITGTSPNAGVYVNQVNGAFGQAGNFVFSGNNVGTAGGAVVMDCGFAPMIYGNELEQGTTNTEVNNSLVDINGGVCSVTGARITGNQLQASTGMGNPALVRLGITTNAVVDGNQISTPVDYVPVVVTAGSTGAIIGEKNTYSGNTTHVTDSGTATLQGITVPYGSGGASQILKRATANGPVTVGQATVGELAVIAANTVIANPGGSVANPVAQGMPSCSTAGSALKWTSGTGFGCNSAITATTNANLTGDVTSSGNATTYNNTVPIAKGGSQMVLLNTLTASNNATLADTTSLTATYNSYEIVFENVVPATTATIFEMQVSTNGGSSYLNSSYVSSAFGVHAGTSVNGVLTTAIPLSRADAAAVSNSANYGVSGRLRIHNPSNSTSRKVVNGQSSYLDTSGGLSNMVFGGYQDGGNTAINAIQFLFSSGNISTGVIKIYGIN